MRKTVLAGMPLAIMPLVTMLALGGCSEPAPAPEVEETPILMQAGEWVLTRKTTGYNTPTVTPERSIDSLLSGVPAAASGDPTGNNMLKASIIHLLKSKNTNTNRRQVNYKI